MNETEILALFEAAPDHYVDRVTDSQIHHLRHDANVGQWGLLLQELLLHLRKASVTPDERDQLAAMVRYVDDEDEAVTIDQPLSEVLNEIPVREPQ